MEHYNFSFNKLRKHILVFVHESYFENSFLRILVSTKFEQMILVRRHDSYVEKRLSEV